MTRLDVLLSAYQHYDTINTALILLVSWVAITGHLLDVMTQRSGKILVTIFWGLVVFAYIAGVILVGSKF